MSSAVRWAVGSSVIALIVLMLNLLCLKFDVAGASGCGDAGLDLDVVAGSGGGDVAGAQVAHGALPQRHDAAEADAHPAPRGHQHAGGLAGVEQRLGAVGCHDGAGLGEGDVPPSPAATTVGRNRSVCSRSAMPSVVPALLRGHRAARPARRPTSARSAMSSTRSSRRATSSIPSVSVCFSTSRIRPWRASMRSSPPKMTSSAVGAECTTTMSTSSRSARLRNMPITGVMPLPAVRNRIFGRWLVRTEGEVAGGLVELDDGADGGPSDQVVADHAVRDRLHGDRDAAVMSLVFGCQRVGPPLPDPVDVDADAHVLAGGVGAPAATGLDHHGDRVTGLGVDRDDAAAQVGARAQRVDDVEVVGRDQRGGDPFGELDDALTQRADDGRAGCCRRHVSILADCEV